MTATNEPLGYFETLNPPCGWKFHCVIELRTNSTNARDVGSNLTHPGARMAVISIFPSFKLIHSS